MKKNIFIIYGIILLLISIIVVLIVAIIDEFMWPGPEPKFDEFKSDYEKVVNVIQREYEIMDNEKIVLSATNSFDLVNFSESPSISLNLSKSEKRCMEDISILSFHRGSGDNFDHIQIESGFITFESLNGRNMITYSHECKNPKKEYPKADYREYRFIKIEKIGIMLKQSKQSFV